MINLTMFIIDIIPLRYLPRSFPQVYSYFSLKSAKEGALAMVSVGRGECLGAVVACRLATDKLSLKKAGFKIKPLKKIINIEPVISKKQLELAHWIADYYFLPLAGVLESILPNEKILTKAIISPPPSTSKKKKNNFYVLGDNIEWFNKKISEVLKLNRQVFLLFPNKKKMDFYIQKLSHLDISVWSGSQSQKKQIKEREAISNGSAKIIFGLRGAVSAPFRDLGLVGIIGEENHYFESWGRKISFNPKMAVMHLAEIFQADLALSGHLPSVESWQWAKEKVFKVVLNKKLVDIESKNISFVFPDFSKGPRKIFFPESIAAIDKSLSKKENIFIFANRLGLSPALSCKECGWTIECPNCRTAMAHYQISVGFQIRCRHCGAKEVPPNVCPQCEGHLMISSGIGTQKVAKELAVMFPETKINIFDSDHIKSIKEEEKVLLDFKSNKIDIIVGTELFLKHLRNFLPTKNIMGLSIIMSFGQLTNFPDFRGREKIRNLIGGLAVHSNNLIIQNFRREDIDINDWIIPERFYPQELKDRQGLLYPPFAELIKISLSGRDKVLVGKLSVEYYKKLKKILTDSFVANNFRITPPLPAVSPKMRNQYTADIFLRIKKSTTNFLPTADYIEKRNEILSILPNEFNVQVEPINPLR